MTPEISRPEAWTYLHVFQNQEQKCAVSKTFALQVDYSKCINNTEPLTISIHTGVLRSNAVRFVLGF